MFQKPFPHDRQTLHTPVEFCTTRRAYMITYAGLRFRNSFPVRRISNGDPSRRGIH